VTTHIYFNSASNNLIGQIPPEISGLRSLSLLALQENCIYGTIPQEVFKLNLSEIDLSWNYLSGVVPQELYGLESLTQLNLHGNKDEGNCNRTDQEPQPVSSKGLGGTILDARIGKLQNLKILQVYMNSFNGTIAPEVGQLNRLGMCFFMIDHFVIVWYLLILSSLSVEKLAANSNNFTGSFPEQVSQMLNLKTLWLGNNSITGRIPESIGLIESLGI
jgi:Leucine-rich repeat (LRR) protein